VSPTLTLSDGTAIPQLGFGTWQIPPDAAKAAALSALEAGYRHIDTAQMYRNERGVGEAVAASGLPRGQVYLTTKLSNSAHAPQAARDSVARSLDDLGTDYLDLMLIHWPLAMYPEGFVDAWEVLIQERAAGRVRSIGVSNFHAHHLDALQVTGVAPVVNQVEVHPWYANPSGRAGEARGIVTEAWSPLASGRLFDDPVLAAIAAETGAQVAQVVIAWHLAAGRIVLPKSVTPSRIVSNLAAAEVVLSADQLARIDALDRGVAGRTGPDPDVLDWRP
jgi:2,5-diketo-D-gluconate reductase A